MEKGLLLAPKHFCLRKISTKDRDGKPKVSVGDEGSEGGKQKRFKHIFFEIHDGVPADPLDV